MDPVSEFIKLGSDLCKEGTTLAPKLADPLSFWTSSSTPLYFKVNPDPVNLIWIHSYFVLYKDVSKMK
jgi:hypothetical protein